MWLKICFSWLIKNYYSAKPPVIVYFIKFFSCGWFRFYWYMNFTTFLNRQKNQFYMLHNANHHIILELFFKPISKCAWLWSCTSSAGRWGWGLGYKLRKQFKKWLTATESVLKLATEETKINVISCLLYH